MKKTIVLDAAQRRGYRFAELTVISEERKRPQIFLSSCFPDSFVLRKFIAGGAPQPARETHALPKFVFIRVNGAGRISDIEGKVAG